MTHMLNQHNGSSALKTLNNKRRNYKLTNSITVAHGGNFIPSIKLQIFHDDARRVRRFYLNYICQTWNCKIITQRKLLFVKQTVELNILQVLVSNQYQSIYELLLNFIKDIFQFYQLLRLFEITTQSEIFIYNITNLYVDSNRMTRKKYYTYGRFKL